MADGHHEVRADEDVHFPEFDLLHLVEVAGRAQDDEQRGVVSFEFRSLVGSDGRRRLGTVCGRRRCGPRTRLDNRQPEACSVVRQCHARRLWLLREVVQRASGVRQELAAIVKMVSNYFSVTAKVLTLGQ